MRLSPEEQRTAVAALLAPRAARLEVRAALRCPAASVDPEQAELWLADEALEDGLRRALAARGSLCAGAAGRLGHLRIRRAALEDLGREQPDARLLALAWSCAVRAPGRLRVMGIVNVTPDSFSDGGRLAGPAAAVAHGLKLIDAGADILDVGGESTRPGATPVDTETELERVLPVVQALARDGRATLSIDTSKAAVAEAALQAGAVLVNDVCAGRGDPRLLPTVAARGAGVLLMHMQGRPRSMQAAPHYDDVVREVLADLRAAAAAALTQGVDPTAMALDPGLGFGKDLEHNLELMRALPELRSLGLPIAIGVSRKSFLGRLSGQDSPRERAHETSAATALAAWLGAEIHRVHEPAAARAALAVAGGLRPGAGGPR